jgi:integrase
MTKARAKELLRELSGAPHATKDAATTLAWFIDNRWKPYREGAWRASTKQTNTELLAIIKGRFGSTPLEKLDKVEMQSWLNVLAAKRSRSCVWHLRTFLMAICAEAVEQDFLVKDPARKLMRPETREPDATVLEWSEYQQVLVKLGIRDRLVVKVAAACAVRPEELFAFRWRHLVTLPATNRVALLVEDTVHRGTLRERQAKTKGSMDYVALPHRLAAELREWRKQTKHADNDDFIFANSRGGFVSKDNFLNRVLYPVRDALRFPKLNFQILRRTFATRAYGERLGNLKDIQKHLRHAKPSTALESYIKELPDSVFTMVDAVYDEMEGTQVSERIQ